VREHTWTFFEPDVPPCCPVESHRWEPVNSTPGLLVFHECGALLAKGSRERCGVTVLLLAARDGGTFAIRIRSNQRLHIQSELLTQREALEYLWPNRTSEVAAIIERLEPDARLPLSTGDLSRRSERGIARPLRPSARTRVISAVDREKRRRS
jgi:hypothetical protein